MTTEREQLADAIADAIAGTLGEVAGIFDTSIDEDLKMADAILAAGYRKPRTVTTVEELDALGHGSVIRSEHRHYWVAHKEDGMDGNQGWAAAGTGRIPADLKAWLPATVLHEGNADV